MRTLRLSLWAITLGISVLGFSQTKGKAFFQHEKTVQNTTFKRSSAGWNDTKNVRLQWIGTKLQHVEGYKSSIPQKQANAAAQPNRHKAAKQQLDSIVMQKSSKSTFAYDKNGNCVYEMIYDWDTTYEKWIESQKSDYVYDVAGNQTMYAVYYGWNGSGWDSQNKNLSTYDANGNQTEQVFYWWDGSGWQENGKKTYAYDTNGNQTEQVIYRWDGSDWQEGWKDTYTYDANGNQTADISYSWNGSGWDEMSKYETVYNTNGKMLFEYSYEWSGTKWDTTTKSVAAYDTNINGNLETVIRFEWNGTDWINSSTDSSVYDSYGNQILYAYYAWDTNNTDWVNKFREETEYDANGNLLMDIYFGFDENDNWVGGKDEFEYDMSYSKTDLIFPYGFEMNNKRTGAIYSGWDGTGWVKMENKEIYYWGEPKVAGIAEAGTNNASVKIYPNPVSSQLHINLNAEESADYAIYTITGQMITSGKLQNTSIIDVESLSNGMYYLKISGKENRTLKIIKN